MSANDYIIIALTEDGFEWHKEDALGIGKHAPVYAVADGVTLPAYEELEIPSGAKIVADTFCKKATAYLEERFDHLSSETIKGAYASANDAIRAINQKHGLTETTVDFEKTYFFSTVAAVAAVKDGNVLGSRITDCGFALVRDGQLIFKTPEFWSELKKRAPDEAHRHHFIEHDRPWRRRHVVNNPEVPFSYGLMNGQPHAPEFVEIFTVPCHAGDYLMLFTDGFEPHFDRKEFVVLFKEKDFPKLEAAIREIDEQFVRSDGKRYGLERTLLISKIS